VAPPFRRRGRSICGGDVALPQPAPEERRGPPSSDGGGGAARWRWERPCRRVDLPCGGESDATAASRSAWRRARLQRRQRRLPSHPPPSKNEPCAAEKAKLRLGCVEGAAAAATKELPKVAPEGQGGGSFLQSCGAASRGWTPQASFADDPSISGFKE
jgi:hypothetical protein